MLTSDDVTQPEKPKNPNRRRGKGAGSVRQRPDGKWEGRIDVTPDANGKRKTKSVYGDTQRAVTQALTRLAGQKLDGTLASDDQTTVSDFLDLWLSGTVKQSTRPATHASYSQNVRVHIKPAIGRIKLAKLTPSHVQGFYAAMSNAGKSARMLQMNHAILRRALSRAVKMGKIHRNVCDAVDRPTIEKHEITPLNVAQVAKLIEAAETERMYSLIVVAVSSGLREGELFAEGLGSCALVFPAIDGTFQRRFGSFRSGFKAILKKAELPTIRWHDLRHSAATLLLSTGCHPKIVQERLGHSTIGITMDTYSHVLPTMQREAVDKLDGLFKTPKPRTNGQ